MGQRIPTIRYFEYGLGYDNSSTPSNVMTMTDMMKGSGHRYIDVLKMDIEGKDGYDGLNPLRIYLLIYYNYHCHAAYTGYEWTFLQHEASVLANIGQVGDF
jgi:hypothetical protein